jgi:asparagine synthase (glutamine-hydrolysing)
MARRHVGPRRLQCFTIAFRGTSFAEEGFADDLSYARRVAEALDVDLHEIEVGPDMIDRLDTMLYHLDEPQADPAPLHVLAICELARSHGIKVLLSGAGGDDIFTGYRRHRALELERWWSWLPRPARAALAAGAGRVKADSAFGRRLRRALAFAALDGPERIASYFLWLEPERIEALLGPALRDAVGGASPLDPLLATLARLPAGTPDLHRMLYLEGKHFLTDHNLNYADKLSMAVGIEVRVPLLDPDLAALAARIAPSLKQHGGVGKWIFNRAMQGVLPAEVIHRPKTGFGAPMRRWLRNELAPVVEDVLAEASLRRRGLLDPHAVRRLVEDDRAGRLDASYPIFALICLELWCRLFLDGGARRYEDEASACTARDATRSAAASS